jgi:23S rRNA pseudouridine2605 synthase
MEPQRLQKYLAVRGVASRRRAEEMIRQGRVRVNDDLVTQMGFQVHPNLDRVFVDGVLVGEPDRPIYVALNKPVGVISSTRDPRGRKTVVDLLEGIPERVYPVGRLDADSEGLVLLTNDGELAVRLAHPRYGVSKLYRIWVKGRPSPRALQVLINGVPLSDGRTSPAQVAICATHPDTTELKIELWEGRNRQIRRMCEAIGHPVARLRREKIGSLALGALSLGQWRHVGPSELAALRNTAALGR